MDPISNICGNQPFFPLNNTLNDDEVLHMSLPNVRGVLDPVQSNSHVHAENGYMQRAVGPSPASHSSETNLMRQPASCTLAVNAPGSTPVVVSSMTSTGPPVVDIYGNDWSSQPRVGVVPSSWAVRPTVSSYLNNITGDAYSAAQSAVVQPTPRNHSYCSDSLPFSSEFDKSDMGVEPHQSASRSHAATGLTWSGASSAMSLYNQPRTCAVGSQLESSTAMPCVSIASSVSVCRAYNGLPSTVSVCTVSPLLSSSSSSDQRAPYQCQSPVSQLNSAVALNPGNEMSWYTTLPADNVFDTGALYSGGERAVSSQALPTISPVAVDNPLR